MATINIQQVDQGLVDRLKRRASKNGRSLEDEALHILEGAAAEMDEDEGGTGNRAEVVKRLRSLQSLTRGRNLRPSLEIIRADRDRDHEYDS